MEGISGITPADIAAAEELGYRIKLLGVAQRTETGIEQRVHPTMVPRDCDIARVSGVTNAVAVEGDFIGSIILSGPGAGGNATASAVVGDIIDLARGVACRRSVVRPPPCSPIGAPACARMKAAIICASRCATGRAPSPRSRAAWPKPASRSIPSCSGTGRSARRRSTSTEEAVSRSRSSRIPRRSRRCRGALAGIEADGDVSGRPQMIRIEAM